MIIDLTTQERIPKYILNTKIVLFLSPLIFGLRLNFQLSPTESIHLMAYAKRSWKLGQSAVTSRTHKP
jgi:hypothetical protein